MSDTDINHYLGEVAGHGFTAKDFRTWQGTVVAARSLSRSLHTGATSPEAAKAAIQEAADWLHNTPAVARDSYVNPRVIALFEQGKVADFRRQKDRAVLALLSEGVGSGPPEGVGPHDVEAVDAAASRSTAADTPAGARSGPPDGVESGERGSDSLLE